MAAETRRTAGTWVLAGGAAALAAAHVLMLLALPHSPGWVIALGVMTLWCLKCSVDALRTGQLLGLLLMSAAMGIAHVVMVLGLPLGHAGHAAHAAASGGHADGHLWMLVIALAEFALMFGCALGISAGRRVRGSTAARNAAGCSVAHRSTRSARAVPAAAPLVPSGS